MLVPQQAFDETHGRYGNPRVSFAELRRQLAKPSTLDDGHRQLLLDLTRRLAQVRAVGDEYARVDLSEHALAAVQQNAAVG